MKTAIIGTGGVGRACALATVMRGCSRELVLLDKNTALAKAVATDLQYGAILSPRTTVYSGSYADLKDSALVMVTAGVNEKAGGATDRNDPAGRLKLLKTNADIYRDIIPQIVKVAPKAIILIVTDPPDPLADVARQLAGHHNIISTGTYLDTLRFKFHLANALKLNPVDVQAQVIGEHGTSSVFLWSSVTVAGKPLCDVLRQNQELATLQKQVEADVKFANITIIEGSGASQYGIGMVCAHIAEMIAHDAQQIIPLGSYQEQFGVTLSLPSMLGSQGIQQVFTPTLSQHEAAALDRCVSVLKKALT